MSLSYITANLSGAKPTRVQLNGREYLKTSAVLIVPGVLNGSNGPLLYTEADLRQNVGAWNGIPITLDHPSENGTPVSGRSFNVYDTRNLGLLLNDRFEGGKRKADAYFDVANVKRVKPSLLSKIENGEPLELSTGLFTDNEPETGTFNGREYHAIARNHRPDHLAVFADKTGACSNKDGCGINVNESGDPDCPT